MITFATLSMVNDYGYSWSIYAGVESKDPSQSYRLHDLRELLPQFSAQRLSEFSLESALHALRTLRNASPSAASVKKKYFCPPHRRSDGCLLTGRLLDRAQFLVRLFKLFRYPCFSTLFPTHKYFFDAIS
ncbi:hypothetical protein PILCRDRAFT_175183 [Piloderma croceum F 1598]|uniref:Uncharacterized protein n=1 Tax=Piloderma croceum (strain F 1598) TaxID=765440 RepID=A0A0C3BUJ8_PILCF|nr:hypothetical protein PILCRDRAFT_175183 [Piloderma croceum F 1598]